MQSKQATEADRTNDAASNSQTSRHLAWGQRRRRSDNDAQSPVRRCPFMVPGKEPFGKAVFARNYENMKGKKMKTDSDIQEIRIIGDWAWMRNFLRVTFISSSGESTVHSGHVLSMLRKNPDGKWVIARDANLLMPENASDH